MKRFMFISIIAIFFLSGCLYPQGELAKNQVPNEAQLETVQNAVNNYRDMTDGLLPIKTKPSETDIYEKYLIDFSMLRENSLISEIPGTAYENGGLYQYMLVTPEENPRVKLIDLRVSEKLREIFRKLDMYRSNNLYPPFGEQIDDGIYRLNYEKLNYDAEPYVVSPFSKNNLPFIMNTDGELFVDYRIDLKEALEEFDHSFEEGDDIRPILEDNYPFVPAYSLPYTIKDGEPAFLINK